MKEIPFELYCETALGAISKASLHGGGRRAVAWDSAHMCAISGRNGARKSHIFLINNQTNMRKIKISGKCISLGFYY